MVWNLVDWAEDRVQCMPVSMAVELRRYFVKGEAFLDQSTGSSLIKFSPVELVL
jgi:hypothetical protein